MAIVQMMVTFLKRGVLMHNPASMRGGDELQKAGKKIPPPLDEARAGLYALPTGQLFIKSDAFREACLTAAKSVRDPTRKGRATMVDRFAASVFLSNEHCLLYRASGNHAPVMSKPEPTGVGDLDGEWTIDVRRAVVQKQGIIRARPLVTDIMCPLEFEIDEDTIDEDMVLAIAKLSGKTPGVLDYRVGRKGPFGRYTVEFANGLALSEAGAGAASKKRKGRKS